jgi:hypothetical protein
VRPIGAQLSTRAVVFLGVNWVGVVWAHAGEAIRRIASTSFFIGFSLETCAAQPLLNRIGEGMSITLFGLQGKRKPSRQWAALSGVKNRLAPTPAPIGLCRQPQKALEFAHRLECSLLTADSAAVDVFKASFKSNHEYHE